MPGRDGVLSVGMTERPIAHGLPPSLFQQPFLHPYPSKADITDNVSENALLRVEYEQYS